MLSVLGDSGVIRGLARRRQKRSNPNVQRVASRQRHAPRIVTPVRRLRVLQIALPRTPLTVYQDRRQWRPEPVKLRPLFAAPRSSGRIVAAPPATGRHFFPPAGLTFKDVRRVALCNRREERKRVIHAIGAAGGSVRPPRRGPWSEISCKR